jgi:hypothetical protein
MCHWLQFIYAWRWFSRPIFCLLLFHQKNSQVAQESVFYLLQCALFSCFISFSKSNPASWKSFLDFIVDVSESLIHTEEDLSSSFDKPQESQLSQRTVMPTPPKWAPKKDPTGCLDGNMRKHKLVQIPLTKGDKTPTRCCHVCIWKNEKRETRFMCAPCGVPLHPECCNTQYHTLKIYWRYVENFKFFSPVLSV